MKNGYDIKLMQILSAAVKIPVIASGGAGTLDHIREVFEQGNVDAALVASLLHYNEYTIADIKAFLKEKCINVR
ncbi:HisA/HisF-related TIM barrel protein [Paenibacillus xerothermodurans]|uniref:HisA/HisF-related TIM barrel protein n=1 Tax=Paenibacillus xerothermodurans TaxID=1977292 RepID=UPI001FB32741|nr:HisA/HisF-related TIM barrel protein [Paenibacillus xerothermodurans]